MIRRLMRRIRCKHKDVRFEFDDARTDMRLQVKVCVACGRIEAEAVHFIKPAT